MISLFIVMNYLTDTPSHAVDHIIIKQLSSYMFYIVFEINAFIDKFKPLKYQNNILVLRWVKRQTNRLCETAYDTSWIDNESASTWKAQTLADEIWYTKIARNFVRLFMRDEERWQNKPFSDGVRKHLLDWINNFNHDVNIKRLCSYSNW